MLVFAVVIFCVLFSPLFLSFVPFTLSHSPIMHEYEMWVFSTSFLTCKKCLFLFPLPLPPSASLLLSVITQVVFLLPIFLFFCSSSFARPLDLTLSHSLSLLTFKNIFLFFHYCCCCCCCCWIMYFSNRFRCKVLVFLFSIPMLSSLFSLS